MVQKKKVERQKSEMKWKVKFNSLNRFLHEKNIKYSIEEYENWVNERISN